MKKCVKCGLIAAMTCWTVAALLYALGLVSFWAVVFAPILGGLILAICVVLICLYLALTVNHFNAREKARDPT